MKLSELCEEYRKIVIESEDEEIRTQKVGELFNNSIVVNAVGANEKLAVARMVCKGCMRKIGNYEYIDYGLQKISFNTTILSRLTDLELDGGNEDGTNAVANYNMALNIGLFDYLWSVARVEMSEFEEFLILENRTVSERNSVSAVLENRKIAKAKKEEDK